MDDDSRNLGYDNEGTLSQQRRCVIFTLAHTKLVHNNCATCHGRHDRDFTIESGLARNNCQLFSQSKQQQLRAASTTTLRPPRPRLDGPIMGPMVMAARLITTVDAGTAGVPYAS